MSNTVENTTKAASTFARSIIVADIAGLLGTKVGYRFGLLTQIPPSGSIESTVPAAIAFAVPAWRTTVWSSRMKHGFWRSAAVMAFAPVVASLWTPTAQ